MNIKHSNILRQQTVRTDFILNLDLVFCFPELSSDPQEKWSKERQNRGEYF